VCIDRNGALDHFDAHRCNWEGTVSTRLRPPSQSFDKKTSRSNGTSDSGSERPQFQGDHLGLKQAVAEETNAAFGALQRNAKLNFLVRTALYLTGWLAVVVAGWWMVSHGDAVAQKLSTQGKLDPALIVELTLPALLLVVLAAACIGSALMIQTRGIDDFEGGLDGISRLRREVDVGVSRSRTSIHALEEYLGNAKSAFRLQMWLCRTLFVICIALFALAVGNGIVHRINWATAALGAGSVVTLLAGTLSGLPAKVGLHLADTTQIQTIVVAATRRINVLEEHLYKLIEANRHDPQAVAPALIAGSAEIGKVAHQAVAEIQRYAEPLGESEKQDR
jgi:hypothetical protein